MARPTKLTPELADILVEVVGLGLSFAEAARVGEIEERTIHKWRERGKAEEDSIYSKFTNRIDACQVSRAQEYLDAVKRNLSSKAIRSRKRIRRKASCLPSKTRREILSRRRW